MMRTVLNGEHRRLGATLVEFAGWEMPLSYTGIVAEALAVRQAAGLFDVSHMGVIEVRGASARLDLERLVTRALHDLPEGRARYALLLNSRGGILDDLFVYSLAPDCLWVVANAANAERDCRWIAERVNEGVQVTWRLGEIAILALQGPRAVAVATAATGLEFAPLRRFGFLRWSLEGQEVLTSRTGYTGEDGLEFFCPVGIAETLWRRLLEAGHGAGVVPCGLGARDVLRIEAGNVLYGHEINEDTGPVEANLMWAVDLAKGDFIGREAVLNACAVPPARCLVGLAMEERAIPRQGAPVGTDDAPTGVVTSGTFSPTLNQAIALAYLPPAEAVPDRPAWIELRGRRRQARVTALPFIRRHG
ncbi:MAG: glycine cleavage system aminomethyltransferase GcvT [Armatimonadetes bacterium]|nr:glycine cleavage system aminomethyltransferase GcvT [Armatimonadota bacterium]